MDGREKIKKMVQEGKIDSEQGMLLLQALKESEEKRERIFKQVFIQKGKRERKIGKFLSLWFLLGFLFIISIFIFAGKGINGGTDVDKSLDDFNQAAIYIEKGDYESAVKLCKRGLIKSPQFSLGYALLGSSYRLLYAETGDRLFKDKGNEAFKKAKILNKQINRRWRMTGTAFFTFIFGVLIFGSAGVVLLLLYNSLVKREEEVNQSWAEVNSQYQRKLDLIPPLLEVVKDYAQYEKETNKEVIEARAKAQEVITAKGGVALSNKEEAKKFLDAQEGVSLGLGKIFALVEKYPELKAGANFLTMQEELKNTEDRICSARGNYNEQVKSYNAGLRLFPSNLMASLFHFEPKEYFKAEEK